jgi:hypothetical protein
MTLVPYVVRDGALRPLKSPLFEGSSPSEPEVAPVANPDSFTTPNDTPVTVNVLANDTGDIDPSTVRIVTPPNSGTAGVNVNGTIAYTPNPNFVGTATFSYDVASPALLRSNTALVTGSITEPINGGTPGTDLPAPQNPYVVNNGSDLQARLNAAVAGDHIIVANGTYTGNYTVPGRSGTAQNPIVIRAANMHGAIFTGNVCIQINGGNHVWVYGLRFNGFRSIGVQWTGNDHRILRNWFSDFGRTNEYINSFAMQTPNRNDRCHIGYNLIENPREFREGGTSFNQTRWGYRGRHPANQSSYDLRIYRNHFRNFPNRKSAGYSDQAEAIELAPIGGFFDTRYRIEYNLFENFAWTQGGVIDVKAGQAGIIEYNTFVNSGMRAIDIRAVKNCTARHNWMENTQGLSMYGVDHVVIGNRVVGSGGFFALRGNGNESLDGSSLARVVNALFQCNIGNLRIGLDYSSTGTSFLPTGVVVNGHTGSVNIQSGSGVTQNPGFSCPTNQAFKLSANQVGPFAGL